MDAQASLRSGGVRCPGLARLPRPRDAPTVAPARPGQLRHHRTRADVSLDGHGLRGEERSFGLEIAAMDALGPGDVAVHSTDAAGTNAPWGELMSTVAKRNGAAGCIC